MDWAQSLPSRWRGQQIQCSKQSNFWITLPQPRCNHTVLCLQHDYERAFRCIFPFQIQRVKPHLQTFFHGLDCKGRWPHKIEWGIFYLMCHPKIYCCICRQSQTWCPLLKLQRRHDFLLDTGRSGPSIAQNTGPLQKRNDRGYNKQHCQKTVFTINGNEVYLGVW